ncbi:FecR domain-containing protein [Hymenobacter sp. BT186]|uniref:FecR domain-containing protein n=1 Tax=Hymenobacter telluris TaxID=2816474 RepID=A0A939EYB6_9BACT|nr:FecR domain-containing protein [Hymenobacter telluris]MBO0360074.1 FecR domain-containing protein [Hymenobacter telluris]MBW3376101.1 FecR domain-containing protein [Hymenobacter norwichensis]
MTEAEFQNLLQRYLDNQCTAQERALVERWYERLDEPTGIHLQSQNQEAVEDAIWQRLRGEMVPEPASGRVVQHPASFWKTAPVKWIAALLVLGVALRFLLPATKLPDFLGSTPAPATAWTLRTNQTQQIQRFALPDNSQITLHPGSSLRYQTAFSGPKREVYLQGEAFFKVSKNKRRPFLVLTKQVVTTVLGTSFRVKAYAGSSEASVAVREGKVAVQKRDEAQLDATPTHPAAAGVLLLPNEQVVYSVASRHLKKQLVTKPALLLPQSFEFEERPVPEVLAALEKAYGVDIVYDEAKLAGCTVSISFTNESLFEKLGLLCKSLGATYTLSDAQIRFNSKGCQLNQAK